MPFRGRRLRMKAQWRQGSGALGSQGWCVGEFGGRGRGSGRLEIIVSLSRVGSLRRGDESKRTELNHVPHSGNILA